jgi:acetolactate synthase-1/3 small subunit
VDVAPEAMIVEMSGQESKIEAFIEMMRPLGIIELARTGRIALIRSRQGSPAE